MSGATPPSAVLQRIKQSTSEEFRALRSRRGTPVYVIEHGLAAEDISELKSALVEALKREPLVSAGQLAAAWRDAFLPLAIVAVEVGYQYGSDGNEYWPRLAETLSTSFDGDAERRALVDGFRRLTALTGVEPPANAWSHQFSLIAWPITHAVLPVWLHEPLLEAIIACPHRVRLGSAASVASGDDYLRWMKEYCARTPRLMSLFDQEPLARTVIERLLGRETGGRLSESFVRRIERDIDAQRRSRQLIRDARRVHVHVTARRAGPGSRAGKPPEHTIPQSATLLLTIDDHQPSLDIAPLLRTTGEIDIALDRVRVRPLGEGRLVSLGSLLRAGARLEVPLLCTDDHHKPLFQEADLKMLDRSLAMRLRQISIDVRDPLLFSEPPGGRGRAHQVLQRRFAERDGWWVLTAQTTDDLPEGVEDKGLVCGLHCLRIDASRGQASDWLRGHGFEPFRQPMVQVVSSPSFDAWHEIAGTLHARDTLAFLVKNGPVEASGLGLLADGLHIVEFESATGPAAIELAQPGARGASIGVTVVESPPVRAALVRVDLEGPSFSVRALIQRSLALRVIGREPIAGLRLTLRLRRGEKVVSRAFSRPLPALPALVAPESTVWDDLTADVTLTERDTLVLEVDVAGLTTATWRLEPTHAIAPRDDASDSRTFIALRPHIAVERGPTSSLEVSSSALNQPFGVDRPLLGQGLCTRATRSAIHLTVSRPERLLRQADDDGPGIGLMTLQSAYLAWTTAQSADKIAEAHRHEAATHLDLWMAECLCGDRWAAVERRRAPRAASYGAFVAQQLYESGVARDPLLEAELGEALSAVQSALLRELAAALEGAEAWLRRIGDRSCGINDACEALANVVNQAYQAALSTTRPNSDTTADVACEPDHCARVLREASAEWEARATLRTFVSLALPQSIRRALQDLEFDGPDDAWLASDLARLLRDTQAKWSDAEVTSLLALWVRPRALIGHVDLTRAISDRVGARALRYAALRRRNAVGVRL